MSKIAEWNGIDAASQRVLFAARELQMIKNGKKMYLPDYNLKDKSQLFVVFQLPGGNDPDTQKKPRLKQLDDDVERSDSPDMITWEDEPEYQRAKMPCGHAIGPESLTEYCRRLMALGKWQFQCPYKDMDTLECCGQIWEYSIVSRHGVLTEDEMIYFENKTSENYMRRAAGIQECPKCQVFCMRRNSKDRRIVCLSCKKDGKTYEFCWYCLGDWNSPGTSNCANDACTGEDPRLKILKEARLKEVVGVEGCPSIRACPKCGLLIEHTEACKHMVCVCGQKFCFICLTKPRADGNYRCGAYNNPCKIAPIQEKIGNMDEDNEDTSVVTGDETADDNTERTSLTLNIDSDLESSEDETEVFFQNEIDIWYERWYAAPIQKKIANTTDEGTERTSLTLNTDSDLGLFADETGYSGDIEIDRLNAEEDADNAVQNTSSISTQRHSARSDESESNVPQNVNSIFFQMHSTLREELERDTSIRMIERGNVEEETDELAQNTSDITLLGQPHRSDRDEYDANSESGSTRSECTIL